MTNKKQYYFIFNCIFCFLVCLSKFCCSHTHKKKQKTFPQLNEFLVEFITPIVKCSKGSKELCFFTIPEYENWAESQGNLKGWKIKYYKGAFLLACFVFFFKKRKNIVASTIVPLFSRNFSLFTLLYFPSTLLS